MKYIAISSDGSLNFYKKNISCYINFYLSDDKNYNFCQKKKNHIDLKHLQTFKKKYLNKIFGI